MVDITPQHEGSYHAMVSDRVVLACFNKDVCAVARDLLGARWKLRPPHATYTISVSPEARAWEWPVPHIDHSIEKDRFKTFPPPFRIGCLIYLNDVPAHAG